MIELTQHNETVSRDSGRNRLRKRMGSWEIVPPGPGQTRRAVVPQAAVLSESYTLACTAMEIGAFGMDDEPENPLDDPGDEWYCP